MFNRYKLVLHASRDGEGLAERLVHAGGNVYLVRLPAGAGHLGQYFHLVAGGGPERLQGEPHVGEQLGDEAPLLIRQGQQQVGLFDLLVAVLDGKALGALDGLQGFLSKLVHVHGEIHSFSGKRSL